MKAILILLMIFSIQSAAFADSHYKCSFSDMDKMSNWETGNFDYKVIDCSSMPAGSVCVSVVQQLNTSLGCRSFSARIDYGTQRQLVVDYDMSCGNKTDYPDMTINLPVDAPEFTLRDNYGKGLASVYCDLVP